MHARRIAALTLPVLLLSACGDAPQRVDPPPPAPRYAQGHSADDGHDHSADDGHDHSAPAAGSPSFSGVIVLEGARAQSEDATIFVSLRSVAGSPPFWTTKFAAATGTLGENGQRRVPFLLNSQTDMMRAMSQLPPELQGTTLQLSVRYDLDGIVDTRDEGDAAVAVPVGWGAEGLEIVVGG